MLVRLVSKRIEFVMRRQTALTPISSASSGINSVWLHEGRRRLENLDIRQKERAGVSGPRSRSWNNGQHPLRCRELSPANSADDTLLGQVAKVDIQRAFSELREDGETSPSLCATDDGDAGERDDNPRGRHQDIVEETSLQRTEYWQCGTNEGTSSCRLRVLFRPLQVI